MSKFLCVVCCFLSLCIVPAAAFGQLSTATAFGDVTDATGAEIPGAILVFTQTQTNFTRSTVTNGQGEYHASFLPVGPYTIKVSAKGFKEMVRSGVVLTVTEHAALNFTLEIGGQSAVVRVTSQTPLVNLGNSVLSKTVDNREIENLPLVGRNVLWIAQSHSWRPKGGERECHWLSDGACHLNYA